MHAAENVSAVTLAPGALGVQPGARVTLDPAASGVRVSWGAAASQRAVGSRRGAGHRVAMVVTPIVAIATLAAGMRVGARRAVHAAIVYGAPRARGESAFAWQVVTLVEDEGPRETEARKRRHGARPGARRGGTREATWRGDTNEDAVAEVRLDLPGVARGEPIDLEVLGDGVSEPLATGRVAWDDAAWMNAAPGPFVRPSKRERGRSRSTQRSSAASSWRATPLRSSSGRRRATMATRSRTSRSSPSRSPASTSARPR